MSKFRTRKEFKTRRSESTLVLVFNSGFLFVREFVGIYSFVVPVGIPDLQRKKQNERSKNYYHNCGGCEYKDRQWVRTEFARVTSLGTGVRSAGLLSYLPVWPLV